MDKLYNEIKNEILKLNNKSKDIKSLLEKSLALSKIREMFSRIDTHYNEEFSNEIHEKLSANNLEGIQAKLNEIEAKFGDEATLSIINDLHKTKQPDLTFFDKEYDSEYKHFVNLNTAVKDTIRIHYQNVDTGEANINNTPKELILALRKESKALLNKDEYVGEPPKETDVEYRFITNFIDRPAANFYERYPKYFKFDSTVAAEDFIRDIDYNLGKSTVTEKGLEAESVFLKTIRSNGKFASDDLAKEIGNAIVKYHRYITDKMMEEPVEAEELPTFGQFIYDVKEKVTEMVLENDMVLGKGNGPEFIKAFLTNPMEGIPNKLGGLNLNDDINYDMPKIISDLKNEDENYFNASFGKNDTWKEHQEFKKDWFMNHLNPEINNKSIAQVIDENKGGFFENFFKTTSDEFIAFREAFLTIQQEGPGMADLDSLKMLAQDYLCHKFKDYVPSVNVIDPDRINRLDATSKGRVNLCLSVIRAIDKAEENIENRDDPKRDGFKDLDISKNSNNIIIEENINFHKKLQNDIEENKEIEEIEIDTTTHDNDIKLGKQ